MANQLDRMREALRGRYRLEREVGAGGMSTVYLAHDERHDRSVAIKVLRFDSSDPQATKRFLREIQIAARLVHPHIVGVHDSGEADGLPFYVMPYVEGETLRQRVAREVRLPLRECVRVVREVASALDHAHSQNILHRDVKPENILFESGHAVVADFGVAHLLALGIDDKVTATGTVVGTPAYMSPEQATADRVDERSDVYSLGCVAFEMLSGVRPFAAATAQASLARKLLEQPTPLRSIAPDLPEAVEHVVLKAMATLPADRYRSPAGFADALESAVTTGAMPRRVNRGLRRRGLLIAAAGFVVAAGALLLGPRWTRGAQVNSLAVLPFTMPGADSTQRYFGDGMHDDVISELNKIGAIRVTSRTSVMKYRTSAMSIPEIARELGVDAVVEGAIYRTADSAKLQLRLVRAVPEERQLWSGTYQVALSNLQTLNSDVTRGIVAELRVALTPRETGRLVAQAGAPRDSVAVGAKAYDAYLQGRYWLNQRSAEGFEKGETELRRAIAMEPGFAAAHAALASLLALKVDWHYTAIDPIAVSREALAEAARALALDSTSGEALAARGRVQSAAHAPEAIVRETFERAIAVSPNHANAHGWYAMELSFRGHARESRAQNDTAIALDPLSPGRHQGFSISAMNSGNLEVALSEARRVTLLNPSLAIARGYESGILLLLGRPQECVALDIGPRWAGIHAACLHAAGRVAEARRVAESAAQRATTALARKGPLSDLLAADNLAIYYAWIGDVDRALHWSEQGARVTTVTFTAIAINSALFDRVRKDPRWERGLAKINDEIWRRVSAP